MESAHDFIILLKACMHAVSKSCIKINTKLTDSFPTLLGVKQGDKLSPNLFKIFINNLVDYLKNSSDHVILNNRSLHCLMYADDVILLSTTSTGLQNKIDVLNKYFEDWCLDVNINNTKILIFNKAGRLITHNFMFNDNSLECVNRYKYLGIYICASGSFSYAQ